MDAGVSQKIAIKFEKQITARYCFEALDAFSPSFFITSQHFNLHLYFACSLVIAFRDVLRESTEESLIINR